MSNVTNEPRQGNHAYAMWATFRVEDRGPKNLTDAELAIGIDGSIWVTSWDHLAEWRDYLGPYDQQAALFTLLFAARGALREVGAEERAQIAAEAWINSPHRLDGMVTIHHANTP